jgi:hypothetical protein
LLGVTRLTLLIMAVVARKAVRETASDRIWLRGGLGSLAVLSLVIVASALGRMWTYEQAYGFSRLRLLVSPFEIWLGVIFLLIIAAGVRTFGPLAASHGRGHPGADPVQCWPHSTPTGSSRTTTSTATPPPAGWTWPTCAHCRSSLPALERLPEPERCRMIAATVEHERSHRPACEAGRRAEEADRVVADRSVPCPPPGSRRLARPRRSHYRVTDRHVSCEIDMFRCEVNR